jgi:hypothetical protein
MKIPWRRCAEPESVVLALAVANWARIGYLIDRSSGVACIVCPWYHSWGIAHEPFRLLAAGVLVRLACPGPRLLPPFSPRRSSSEGVFMGSRRTNCWRSVRVSTIGRS